MKVEDVEAKVAGIKKLVEEHQHERAHLAEDDLYKSVVEYVAEGHNQFHAGKLAKAALKTREINIRRMAA